MKWVKQYINDITNTEYKKWYSIMSDEKKQRVDSYISDNSKRQSVIGEILARKLISETLNIDPESIIFKQTSNGKPYALNLNIAFNISHSGNLVVCAVDENAIGIDVEQIKPINLKIAKRFCTDDELKYIFAKAPTPDDFVYSDNSDILHRFYEIWTSKEAFCKWTGNGISDLNLVNFNLVNKKSFVTDNYYISIIYDK